VTTPPSPQPALCGEGPAVGPFGVAAGVTVSSHHQLKSGGDECSVYSPQAQIDNQPALQHTPTMIEETHCTAIEIEKNLHRLLRLCTGLGLRLSPQAKNKGKLPHSSFGGSRVRNERCHLFSFRRVMENRISVLAPSSMTDCIEA
jgi:hypothetical protein